MGDRQKCVDCHELSPETDTNYTLIGSRFGWRLTRTMDAKGVAGAEWRCPGCWKVYKAARGDTAPPSARLGARAADPPSGTRRAAPPAPDDDPSKKRRTVPPLASRKR
jgi:hypothetical protein